MTPIRTLVMAAIGALFVPLVASAPLPFSFGSDFNDVATPPNDDGSSRPFDLPFPMMFYGDIVTRAYQNTNGCITFDGPFSQFTPSLLPSNVLPPMAAGFWTDIDTRRFNPGGNILLASPRTDEASLATAESIVRSASGSGSFVPDAVFVATWIEVEEFPRIPNFENTLQIAMAYNTVSTWVIFSYETLEWLRPGTIVGFNDRRGISGTTITELQSTTDLTRLVEESNVGRPGTFAYEVTERVELTGCGVAGIAGISLVPGFGPINGGTVLHLQNLPECIEDVESVAVMCRFRTIDGQTFHIEEGVILREDIVECITPFGGVTTSVEVSYAITDPDTEFNPDEATWFVASRRFQYTGETYDVTVDGLLFDPLMVERDMLVEWDYDELRRDALFNANFDSVGNYTEADLEVIIELEVYNEENQTTDVIPLLSEIDLMQNNGVVVTIPEEALGSVPSAPSGVAGEGPFLRSLLVNPQLLRIAWVAISVGIRAGRSIIRRLRPRRPAIRRGPSRSRRIDPRPDRESCERLVSDVDPSFANSLPPCPPTYDQRRAGAWADDTCNINKDDRFTSTFCNFFHEGARGCIRSVRSPPGTTYGQQCCYGRDRQLLRTGREGGGTADLVSPEAPGGSVLEHFTQDVYPFLVCCKFNSDPTACDLYFENFPIDDGSGWQPEEPVVTFGDPHLLTADGINYDFNGAGEYVGLCALLPSSTTAPGPINDTAVLLNACGRTVPRLDGVISRDTLSVHLRFAPLTSGDEATVTVGVAISDPSHRMGDVAIAIVVSSERRVDVFDGNELVEFFGESPMVSTLASGVFATRDIDDTTNEVVVTITTPSGLVVNVRELNGILLPSMVVPPELQGRAIGLWGLVDRDPSNDFTNSFGNVLSQTTLDAIESISERNRQIFDEFGQTWMISSESSSLFQAFAMSSEAFIEFFQPDFRPSFDPLPAVDESVAQAATAACASIVSDAIRNACEFDARITGQVEVMAAAASSAQAEFTALVTRMQNAVPEFIPPTGVSGQTIMTSSGSAGDLTFPVVAIDSDGTSVRLTIDRNDGGLFGLVLDEPTGRRARMLRGKHGRLLNDSTTGPTVSRVLSFAAMTAPPGIYTASVVAIDDLDTAASWSVTVMVTEMMTPSPTVSVTTVEPSVSPTTVPTTSEPSVSPTTVPTTSEPSVSPTTPSGVAPVTMDPTPNPTRPPTRSPTEGPTDQDDSDDDSDEDDDNDSKKDKGKKKKGKGSKNEEDDDDYWF